MSIKKEFEERTVTRKVCVKKTTICDVCGKKITGGYYDVTTSHSDWGRDSVDSLEYNDVCSEKCLRKLFDEYIEISTGDYNTQKIVIEHCNEPEGICKNECYIS